MLIADDDRIFAQMLAEFLRNRAHDVVDVVYCGLDAIRAYRRHRPDVVLMDFAMDRLNGLTACRNILSEDRAGRVLFLSAMSEHHALAPESSGAFAVLQKPIGFGMLERVLHDAEMQRASSASAPAECVAAVAAVA